MTRASMPLTIARTLETLALCLWLGGFVVAGAIVAPVTFGTLERAEAGRVMGEVFRRLNTVGIVCGGVLLFALALEAGLAPPALTRSRLLRAAYLAIALGIALSMGFSLFPEMEALRGGSGTAASQPSPAFTHLHEFSRRLIGAQMLMLLFTIVLSAAASARRLTPTQMHPVDIDPFPTESREARTESRSAAT